MKYGLEQEGRSLLPVHFFQRFCSRSLAEAGDMCYERRAQYALSVLSPNAFNYAS